MAVIQIQMTQGAWKGKRYEFNDRSICVIGRALDCNILLPDDEQHSTISRYHCLLDINPPEICIRDFGSLNGTFVNNKKIGQRNAQEDIYKAQGLIYPEYNLHHGDQIQLGDTILEVAISSQNTKEDSEGQQTEHTSKLEHQINMGESSEYIAEGSLYKEGSQSNPLDKVNKLLKQADSADQNKQQKPLSIKGYIIRKELGRGNMGAVYLASHHQSRSNVALKVMLPKVESNPRAHKQFMRETRNTQLLKHKNIVRVYDVGCHEGTYFFTTDYCEGGSVAQLIKNKGGRLPLSLALKIYLQILDGLAYAHQVKVPSIVLADGKTTSGTGLVHRDIKPGNILLSHQEGIWRARIADFGLAKAFDTAGLSGRTATGVSAGTPYYMPRQQIINFKLAKPEVDIWAATATFYKMLTGRHPRNYSRRTDPWLTTLKMPPVSIMDRDAPIPSALGELIDKVLNDKPQLAFKSVIALKSDLLKVI